MSTVYEKIKAFNHSRDAEMVQRKYKLLTENAFRFFRGTCHLFYEDLATQINWKDKTKCWISGDLHLENFGSYKGDNRVVYFDVNDFDEALLAPASWELVRLLTSIHIASQVLRFGKVTATMLCNTCMDTYLDVLHNGKPKVVEKETADGLLRKLLQDVKKRKESSLIKERTAQQQGSLKLRIDDIKIVAIAEDFKKGLFKSVKQLFANDKLLRGYVPVDIAIRIAGTGSVGLERYVVLTQRKHNARYRLIDIKESTASSLMPFVRIKQPKWHNEADRIITLQKRIQHVSPALLHPVVLNGKSFVVKELQPTQDRMDLLRCKGDRQKMKGIIDAMAEITASAQLRSAGRQGSVNADVLIGFAAYSNLWRNVLMDYATKYSTVVFEQYHAYCKEYKKHDKVAK